MVGRLPDVDKHIGNRIRVARTLAGLSQESLGDVLGVTFQQVQKYENGKNRVAACTLVQIAKHLDRSVAFFLPDQDDSGAIEDPFLGLTPQALQVALAFSLIADPTMCATIRTLVVTAATEPIEAPPIRSVAAREMDAQTRFAAA